MRVLVAAHNYPRFSGDPAGAFVARLARAASRAGHEVRVVTPHVAGTPEDEQAGGLGLRRFRYAPERFERVGYGGDLHTQATRSPLLAMGIPVFLAAFRRALRAEVRAFAPDVVHAHWWIPAGWIASSLGVPLVVTCHGSDVRLLDRSRALRVLARRVFARAAAVTAVSRFLVDDLRRLAGARLDTPFVVTHMPVDVAHFASGLHAVKAAPPRILYAGNILESKGVDVLVEAFAQLRREGVACRLKILGEGPALPGLRALAADRGLTDEIDWSGFVPQERMPDEYGASTIAVLPTRGNAEGLGLTLVEALLSGCAVVGTPAGGIPEVVQHEVTGLLARSGDASDLAAQLRRLLTDPPFRDRMAAQGREQAIRTFAPESSVSRFLSLYEDAARDHRAG